MAQGWVQIVVFLLVLTALVPLVGSYIAARLPRRTGLPLPGPRPGRALRLPGDARAARGGAGLEGIRPLDRRLQPALLARALPDPSHPEHPAAEPRGLRLRPLEPQLQHRLLLRHQHQLAVLRRRDDALLLRPDGRADGAELRLGRGRDRRARRRDPRLRRSLGSGARQLLVRPRSDQPLRPAADRLRRGAGPRLPGRDPDPRRLDDLQHDRRRARRPWRSARSPRRRRSRSWGPTAAASSTSTAPTRSRTRAASPTWSSCC